MNSNWRNRPTKIEAIPKEIDYIISIDENGTANLKKVLEAKRKGMEVPDSERHFTVTACRFRTSEFLAAKDLVMALKEKYWPNALFQYGKQQKRVCFHSREIRGRKGPFHSDVINRDAFIADLSNLIEELPMLICSAHIDKAKHVRQYAYPSEPYELCMDFVLERLMKSMSPTETCVIILEARGKQEDRELLNQIKALIDFGNDFTSASTFSKIKGVYFNPKWSEEAHCQKSYWSLEIADVCSYPIHKYLCYDKKDPAFLVVEKKLRCYPRYIGRGLKIFP